MKKKIEIVLVILFVLTLCTPAIAGPECKSYTMYYEDDTYTLEFGCATVGIGEVQSLYNVDEYEQWWMYFYVESRSYVIIAKLASFELADNNLYHVLYDYTLKKWYRTGLVFIGSNENLQE